ncbi:hypothetical protein [Cellulomonas pakistanensis]|uniref:Lipoprotein n=1 Tax=Cellulomonas pakistanensis TaxID=992287 RepID=A0A919P8M3_9CELL|nr:hypothetical protein [Cellulomonas pakistanensis]GIG34906.1 hypothetical protein Cpa01nite_02870 [Cellulomonas pakistanensis]
MTRPFVSRPAAALVVGLAVAGCSAPTGADDEAVTAWMDERAAEPAPDDLLGTAAARVGPEDPAPADSSGAVALRFAAAAHLDGVRLSCLGDGALDFHVYVTTEANAGITQTDVLTFPDVPCGAEAREKALDLTGVVGVGVTGAGADRRGAWHALVLGTPA